MREEMRLGALWLSWGIVSFPADAHTTPSPTTPTVPYETERWEPKRPYGEKEWGYCPKCAMKMFYRDAARDWTGAQVHPECVDERPITKPVRRAAGAWNVQLGWRHRT